MTFTLTQKDLLELKYWLTANMAAEQAMLARYLTAFSFPLRGCLFDQLLEIGTGPHWGLLPHLNARRKFGIDPLYPVFHAAGILADRNGVMQVDECFERWDTNETFDAIVSTNALDHGEMGFYLLPKIARLLRPGGCFFLHVHLRPPELLNLIHDHALTLTDLDKQIGYTNLIEVRRSFGDRDVDGGPFPALVGIWRKPA